MSSLESHGRHRRRTHRRDGDDVLEQAPSTLADTRTLHGTPVVPGLAYGRVVRPVYFPRMGGQMEWSAPDGNVYEASFDHGALVNLDALVVHIPFDPRARLEFEGLRGVHRAINGAVHHDMGSLHLAVDAGLGQGHILGTAGPGQMAVTARPVRTPEASVTAASFSACDAVSDLIVAFSCLRWSFHLAASLMRLSLLTRIP